RLDASGELGRRVRGEAAPPAAPAAAVAPPSSAQIFGSDADQWTGRCKILFEQRGVAFEFVDVDDPRQAGVRERLAGQTRRSVLPYVFVRGQFIGGWNELDELDRLGKLDELLDPAAASARSPVKVVVAERPGGE